MMGAASLATEYRIVVAVAALLVLAIAGSGCDRFEPAAPRPPARGPLRVHESNGRYLDDGTGRAILLAGSHTWTNLQDAGPLDPPEPMDFIAYLQMLVDHHHNFIRMWRLSPAWYRYADSPKDFVHPMPWVRTGPGDALDGQARFDLTRFNEEYFSRLRERVQQAGAKGMYVAVMLFEGHALAHAEEAWKGHPFHAQNNVNGVNADANGDGRGLELHMLLDDATLAHQEAYVRHVVHTLNDLENVLWEICNESHPESDAWQKHMIDFVHELERSLPLQHPVIYSASLGGSNEDLRTSSAEILSLGKEWVGNRVPLRDDPEPTEGDRVLMLDTDHLWGCGGESEWVFRAVTRGYHPIYMDPWEPGGACGEPDQQMRRNLGTALRYAERMTLAEAAPLPHLASSEFCLAVPAREYLVFVPSGRDVELDLRDAARDQRFAVEWFDTKRLVTHTGADVLGGKSVAMRSPIGGPVLLFVSAKPHTMQK